MFRTAWGVTQLPAKSPNAQAAPRAAGASHASSTWTSTMNSTARPRWQSSQSFRPPLEFPPLRPGESGGWVGEVTSLVAVRDPAAREVVRRQLELHAVA